MSAVETTDHVSEAPEPVDLQSMRALAATPGAGIADQPKGRTGTEKVDALNAAAEKTAEVDPNKTLFELAAGNKAEVAAAIQQIVYVLERHFNIDFVREAPLAEVTSGIAAARAAMSGTSEAPQEVDDRIIPPGTNNPTDDVLPPNIPVGEPIPGTDVRAGIGDTGPEAADPDAADTGTDTGTAPAEAPAKSATREDWDAYATSQGLNPADYSTKEDLQKAVAKQQA